MRAKERRDKKEAINQDGGGRITRALTNMFLASHHTIFSTFIIGLHLTLLKAITLTGKYVRYLF